MLQAVHVLGLFLQQAKAGWHLPCSNAGCYKWILLTAVLETTIMVLLLLEWMHRHGTLWLVRVYSTELMKLTFALLAISMNLCLEGATCSKPGGSERMHAELQKT